MMEHISQILKQTQINTLKADTGTWSNADEPSPAGECPICNGAGVVHPLLPSGKPDFRRVVPCRCAKKELGKERQSRLQRYSNLGQLSRLTFDNLIPQGRSGDLPSQEQFKKAYEAAKAFAAEPKGWFILSGPSGSGKTHIAAAIANERLNQGQPAFYVSAPDLLDHLRSAFNPGSALPYDEFFDQVRNVPLLVLDDLGAQTSTPWAKEKLDQLLTYRFTNELPTIIVTITPIELMEERLRTRLADPTRCRVYVLEEKQANQEYSWGPEFKLERTMTFATFDYKRVNLLPEQRDNLEQAFRLAFEFAKSPEGWLVFMGVAGCGKTHLAAAVVNYRYEAHQPALFIVVPEFLDHLRSAFRPESGLSYDHEFERVKTTPLLVLDDFGEQSTTPWAREKLYQLLNYRYNARLGTVITTRYSLEEILEKIDSSISSRMVDSKISTPFNITAPDYRGDVRPGQGKRSPKTRKNWS
ncbi:MAG: ATP-binding protein [Dehalococcoidales bacterium]|nr:ATP-binding protein [Dehalococcoidales bacterium]